MVADLAAARGSWARSTTRPRPLLTSPAPPDRAAAPARPAPPSPPAVAPGNRQLGVMLPYTPLHHLLLADRRPARSC